MKISKSTKIILSIFLLLTLFLTNVYAYFRFEADEKVVVKSTLRIVGAFGHNGTKKPGTQEDDYDTWGTKPGNPFQINNKHHFKNLVNFTNKGTFEPESGKPRVPYYFELAPSVGEDEGVYIENGLKVLDLSEEGSYAPIGSGDIPFYGIFNGNGGNGVTVTETIIVNGNPVQVTGSMIKGLTVESVSGDIDIGMFGYIGMGGSDAVGKYGRVHDLILSEVKINSYNNNPPQAIPLYHNNNNQWDRAGADRENCHIGILCGHLDGWAYNISVHKSDLDIQHANTNPSNNMDYYSKFGIIGFLGATSELGQGADKVTGGQSQNPAAGEFGYWLADHIHKYTGMTQYPDIDSPGLFKFPPNGITNGWMTGNDRLNLTINKVSGTDYYGAFKRFTYGTNGLDGAPVGTAVPAQLANANPYNRLNHTTGWRWNSVIRYAGTRIIPSVGIFYLHTPSSDGWGNSFANNDGSLSFIGPLAGLPVDPSPGTGGTYIESSDGTESATGISNVTFVKADGTTKPVNLKNTYTHVSNPDEFWLTNNLFNPWTQTKIDQFSYGATLVKGPNTAGTAVVDEWTGLNTGVTFRAGTGGIGFAVKDPGVDANNNPRSVKIVAVVQPVSTAIVGPSNVGTLPVAQSIGLYTVQSNWNVGSGNRIWTYSAMTGTNLYAFEINLTRAQITTGTHSTVEQDKAGNNITMYHFRFGWMDGDSSPRIVFLGVPGAQIATDHENAERYRPLPTLDFTYATSWPVTRTGYIYSKIVPYFTHGSRSTPRHNLDNSGASNRAVNDLKVEFRRKCTVTPLPPTPATTQIEFNIYATRRDSVLSRIDNITGYPLFYYVDNGSTDTPFVHVDGGAKITRGTAAPP